MKRLLVLASLFAGLTAMAAPVEPSVEPKAPKKTPAADSKSDAPAGDVDVAKTTERIIQDATEAGKRLEAKDPGDDTQRLQKEIVKNIDALLRKAQEPSPPQNNDSSDSSKKQSSSDNGATKQPKDGSAEPQAGDPSERAGKMDPSPNRIEPKSTLPHFPDVYKDVWGHLPEKMRMEMDLYFREQFMPRYSELLKQYYSSLSELNGKTGNGK
jgi:hypothetical protein